MLFYCFPISTIDEGSLVSVRHLFRSIYYFLSNIFVFSFVLVYVDLHFHHSCVWDSIYLLNLRIPLESRIFMKSETFSVVISEYGLSPTLFSMSFSVLCYTYIVILFFMSLHLFSVSPVSIFLWSISFLISPCTFHF